eukprot:evm.model.scf_3161.1 EVM.evm.TU.scf_3161.1   scf_3161:9188-14467(+)
MPSTSASTASTSRPGNALAQPFQQPTQSLRPMAAPFVPRTCSTGALGPTSSQGSNRNWAAVAGKTATICAADHLALVSWEEVGIEPGVADEGDRYRLENHEHGWTDYGQVELPESLECLSEVRRQENDTAHSGIEEHDLWDGPQESWDDANSHRQSFCWQYLNGGFCVNGDSCTMLHGEYCETCTKYCLHPEDEQERQMHKDACKQRHSRLDACVQSAEMECGICLEKVLKNPNPALRKFGLMNCEHCFCLSCIRNWRSNSDGEFDLSAALRTCPICRTTTYFITPSAVWPTNREDKERIVESYKQKLASIDCKYFNFGAGECPFGTSCFYRHVDKDGVFQDVKPRFIANAEGEVKSVRPMHFGDLLNTASARRIMNRRRR